MHAGVYTGMFEHSVLANCPTNKRWSVLISLSGELALLTLAILLPLAYTDQLPHFDWKNSTLSPPPAPRPIPVAPTKSSSARNAATFAQQPVFQAPTLRNLADLNHLAPEPAMIEAPQPGVQGSIGANSGALNTFLLEKPVAPPPPSKPAVEKAPSAPIRVSIGVQMAKLVKQVIPVYPQIAKAARISGVVHLVGVIGKDGRIQQLQLLSGHPMLAQAALDAVRQWIYKPTLLNGEPVEVTAPIDVNFTLTQ